jgi:hypothetical protein
MADRVRSSRGPAERLDAGLDALRAQLARARKRRQRVRKIRARFGVGPRDPGAREYAAEIRTFWRRHFGHAVDPSWHWAFAKLGLGRDPRFVPSHEWWDEILPFLNDLARRPVYRDKNLSDRLVDPARTPRTVLKRMHGAWYDADGRRLSRAAAAGRLVDGDEARIVKPARADNGRGVRRFEVDGDALRADDGVRVGLDELEAIYGGDLIVQERIRQHPSFEAVHPPSVNTLRLVTLRWADALHPLLALARFGRGGRPTDNAGTGGILCHVHADGRIADHALDLDGRRLEKHPDTGHAFSEPLVVPGFDGYWREALRLHDQIPWFDFVSWDFAVGEDGGPVFLEMNFQGVIEAYQTIARRPLLGARTEEILEAVRDARPRGRWRG